MQSLGKTRKYKRWKQTESKINCITDRQGLGIDSEITESIVALQTLGFTTTASCQGHLDHVNAAPWVNIGENVSRELLIKKRELKGLLEENDAAKIRFITKKNLKEQIRLMKLLDEFYRKREVSYDVRLVLNRFDIYGDATLESTGERFQVIRSKAEQKEKFTQYRNEMKAFTDFLKMKYFQT
jgi:hypothetical protein